MIFSFFSRDDTGKALAQTMANMIKKNMEPAAFGKDSKLLSTNKVVRMLEGCYALAVKYKETEKIGFMKSAKLANAFKWELRQMGYPDEFVDLATEGLIMAMMNNKPQS